MRWLQAFQRYVLMLLTRVNTITGVRYSDDPTIFALELANEPHTTDNYEEIRGLPPGSLVKTWMKIIVATIKLVDTNHMVSLQVLSPCSQKIGITQGQAR